MIGPLAQVPSSPFGGWRTRLSWMTGLLILAAVVLIASRLTEIERFAELARSTRPIWLLAALVLQAMTYLCAAGVLHVSMKRTGVRPHFWSIVPLGLVKLFTDQALPTGGISGTLMVLRGLVRRGVANGVAMAVLLISLVSFYAAYLMAVVIGLGILYSRGTLDLFMLAGAGVFLLIAFGIPAFGLAVWRWSRLTSRSGPIARIAASLARLPGLSDLLSAMAAAPTELLRDPQPYLQSTLLQFLIFVLDACTLWVMLLALGTVEAPPVAYAAFMMASLAATVGPMPLGLGTFEAVSVAVLHVQGVPIEVALTATLLLRGFTFWLPMIPGLILARRELHASASIQSLSELSATNAPEQ